MKVGDIFVALGFKVDDGDLKDFQTGIDNLTKSLTLNVAAVAASIYAADRFIGMGVEQARAIGNFTAETGQSADELQRWMSINRKFGIENETTIGSISNLSKKLFELKRTGQGSGPFAFLNAMPDMNDPLNPFKVIEKLRESFKTTKLSRTEFTNYLEQIGLDGRMIRAITLTNDELDRFSAITTRLSDRDIKNLENAGAIIDEFKQKVEVTFANFLADHQADIVKGVDLLYDVANGAAEAGKDLKEIAEQAPIAATALTVAAGVILAAWKPVFAGFAGISLALADYGNFKKDNQGEDVGARMQEGQPGYAGDTFIAKLGNFLGAAMGFKVTSPALDAQGNPIEQYDDIIGSWLQKLVDDQKEDLKAMYKPPQLIDSNGNVINFNNNFNVQTTEDGESFGRTLSPVLNEQMKQGLVQFNNGTER